MKFSFGIEHEVAFLNAKGTFADFSRTEFNDFDQIIQELPIYPEDYPQLRVGDAGIKVKRWYIEGFERFEDSEQPVDCVPKGIEIRTTIHTTIRGAITELAESFNLLRYTASAFGFCPVLISFNPYFRSFEPDPPLNEYELKRRLGSPEKQTANIPMLTYGPDLSLSVQGISTGQLIEVGQKLTYYSPYIIPFSFSSPFYEGILWPGLSVRTFIRTGARPAVMVFIKESDKLVKSVPSLTKMARVPAEVGRIEFKAFDSCANFSLYAGLFALLKGLTLDQSLPGRATVPDAQLHRISAQAGFSSQDIFLVASKVVEAAAEALAQDPDAALLEPLEYFLVERKTPAHRFIEKYKQVGCIEKVLQDTYTRPMTQ